MSRDANESFMVARSTSSISAGESISIQSVCRCRSEPYHADRPSITGGKLRGGCSIISLPSVFGFQTHTIVFHQPKGGNPRQSNSHRDLFAAFVRERLCVKR